jgi:hypothetical protein
MKKFATHLSLSILMILTIVSVGYSQNSSDSTGVNRAELIALCEKAAEEVKISRIVISDYKEAIAGYEAVLEAQSKVITLSEEQIALMKAEIVKLREALAAERKALVFKEKEAAELRKALAKATKKKNFFKSIAKITTAVAAVAVGVLVLKQ